MALKINNKLLFLIVLVIIGIGLQLAGLLEPRHWLDIARRYTDHWWLIILLILLQAVLFTFALAGSTFLWIVSPIYTPPMATFILVAGGTLGGISAYYFSRRLTDEWIHKIEKTRVYRLLQKEDNFFTLLALRIMPAFPHSVINYSSGILQIRLSHFIAAVIIGLTIKCYVFTRVIYTAASSSSLDSLMDFRVYGPLVIASVIIFSGILLKYWWQKHKNSK